MSGSLLEFASAMQGSLHADFTPKHVRKTMRIVGADVRKNARRLVARRAISHAGQYPGMVTGELMRSIQAHVSRSGWSVRIASYRTARMKAKNAFYPAYLVYGTSHGIAPRKDWIDAAHEARTPWIQQVVSTALLDGVEVEVTK